MQRCTKRCLLQPRQTGTRHCATPFAPTVKPGLRSDALACVNSIGQKRPYCRQADHAPRVRSGVDEPAALKPSATSPESSPLSFIIYTFDDPQTCQPTQYARFARNWQDNEALDLLMDKLEAGQLSHKQGLMQARKLEATTPYNLEIQNFVANRM